MKTLDVSNLVVLYDGVKNNHECEIVSVNNQRVNKVERLDPRYSFHLRDSKSFKNGKYVFDENNDHFKLWVIVTAYGGVEKSIIEGIDFIVVSTVRIANRILKRDDLQLIVENKLKKTCPEARDVKVKFMVGQDQLIQKAKSFKKSTPWERICYLIQHLTK
jgi:hypothetical protein